MKKYYSLGIAAICAALFSVSCEVESIAPEQSEQSQKSELTYQTFTCTIDVDETKVDIDAAGKTKWVAGDKILVHGERYGTSSSKLYSTIIELTSADLSNGDRTATIKVPVDENGVTGIVPYVHKSSGTQDYKSTLYAQYPAEASYSGSLHCYYHSVFVNTNNPLMIACDNGEGEFIFENLCGLITFTLPSSCDFDSYVFKGNSGETIGYSQYAAKRGMRMDGSYSKYNPYSGGDFTDPTHGPLTTISATPINDGTTLNKIFITRTIGENNAYFSKGFTIQFIKGGDIVQYVANKNEFTLKPGHQINLGDISGKLKPYVAPANHDSSIDLTGATDLSDGGSANCYVVYKNDSSNADKVFKFKAVRGNSDESVGKVAGASIVWQTYNTETSVTDPVIAEVDYDKQGDECYIVFKMPSSLHSGNALIAATNASGTVLWSWHIWVPETTYTSGTFDVSSVKLMSRNLGALKDTEPYDSGSNPIAVDVTSFGLYYQWGRKDPFVGPKRNNSSSHAAVSGTDWSITTTQLSLNESIEAPTSFVTFKGDWCTTHDNERWGNSGSKTIYDPCPKGYRVPKRNTSYPVWGTITDDTSFVGDNTNKWWTLGTATFPLCGYIRYDTSSGSFSSIGTGNFMWTAYRNSDEVGYCSYLAYESSAWVSQPSWGQRKACGCTVRCQVDE